MTGQALGVSVGELPLDALSRARTRCLAWGRRASLGAPPLQLAGRTADSLSRTRAWLTDGTTISGVLVRFSYGQVRVSLAHDAAGSYAIGFGEGEFPTPPQGSVAVTGDDAHGWQGELR